MRGDYMANIVEKVDKEMQVLINDWDESEALEFLKKGGIIKTKVTNYNKYGEITSYSITEKQIAPNVKMHQKQEDKPSINKLQSLRSGLK